MARRDDTALDLLDPREAERQRARQRKRSTRMVVDGAGIRRVLLERRARGAGSAPAGGADGDEVATGSHPAGR